MLTGLTVVVLMAIPSGADAEPFVREGIAAVAASGSSSCVILDPEGSIICWGAAIQSLTSETAGGAPARSLAGAPWHALVLGTGFGCAIRTPQVDRNVVRCWGRSDLGQLGGAPSLETKRELLDLPTTVHGLAAGGDAACAATDEGGPLCWGSDASGQLGDGLADSSGSGPRPVVGADGTRLPPAVLVSMGAGHACALMRDETVACWGSNTSGQLGVGDIAMSTSAVPVPGITGVVSIASGAHHTCAARYHGPVVCWGDLGRTPVIPGEHRLVVLPTTLMLDLSGGDRAACARAEDGRGWCWGRVPGSQGVASEVPLVIPVGEIGGIALGAEHACVASATERRAWCWGSDLPGFLGLRVLDPVPITDPVEVDLRDEPATREGRSDERQGVRVVHAR